MTKLLEAQADRIEGVLHDFGISGQVFGGDILPRVVSFLVQLGPGHRVRDVAGLHEEIALALDVPGVLVHREGGSVAVQVPRPEYRPLPLGGLLEQLQSAPPPHTTLLGMSIRGSPLVLYMPSPEVAHVLIAGMTGCGKTELLRTMLVTLSMWTAARQLGLYLIDPKGRKLAQLAGLPDVMESVGVEGAPMLLEQLLLAMERRDAEGYCSPRLYLIIDELADLMMVHGKTVEVALTRLVQRGREAGIHVICTTQRPSAKVVQGLMKANFPIRISGAVSSALDASIATGMARSGAERLLGKGDMLLAHRGQLVRFQACITPKGDIEGLGQVEEEPGVRQSATKVLKRLRRSLNIRGPGRPAKGPTKAMVAFALGRIKANGKCSQRELRRWHKGAFGTDVHPPRAASAIEEARRRSGLRFG